MENERRLNAGFGPRSNAAVHSHLSWTLSALPDFYAKDLPPK